MPVFTSHLAQTFDGSDQILVAVTSCKANRDKREAIRDTWKQTLSGVGFAFFVGGTPEPDETDVIGLACSDDYASLPMKTYSLVTWAHAVGFRRMVKVDDDTYLRWPDAQGELFDARFNCVGHVREESSAAHNGNIPYPQGGCYSLDSAAMTHIIANPSLFIKEGIEDGRVGQALKLANLRLGHSARIFPSALTSEPSPHNLTVAAHHVAPDHMRAIYAHLAKGKYATTI